MRVLGKFPMLACDLLKLNNAMEQLLPKSFDTYLSKLQRFTTDAMAPIAWLQEQMLQGEVDKESATKALDVVLELLGNASAHFYVERRKEVIKHLNSDLKYLAVKEFPQSGFSLFGEDFRNKAKIAVDNIRALKGIQSNENLFLAMVAPREGQSPHPRVTDPIGASLRHQTNKSSTGWARHNTRNSRKTSLSSKRSPRTTQSRLSTFFEGPT